MPICPSSLMPLVLALLAFQATDADKKRGSEVFKDTARKFGGEMAAQLKTEDSKEHDELLKHAGVKSEKEIGMWMGDQLLKINESALALSEEMEKDLRAGMFNDEGNRKYFEQNLKECSELKLPMPTFIVHLVKHHKAGKLTGGLDLEFASRVLAEYLALVRPK